MVQPRPEPGRPAFFRRALLLSLYVGLVFGGLDLVRIFQRGDLTPANVYYLIVLLNMAQAAAVGFLLSLLLGFLPRRGLTRFTAELVQLPFPGPRAETAAAFLLLLLVAVTGPLTLHAEERRLAREIPTETDSPAVGSTHPDGDRHNVIILVMDTVRADHLSLYGYQRATTPNLERLAPEFLVCRNAISPAPWTVPSHASLFTGLYPSTHGARSFLPAGTGSKKTRDNVYALRSSQHTLALILGSHGYLTAGLVSNPFLVPRTGLAQGFQFYQSRPNRNFLVPLRCQWLMKTMFEDRWRSVFDKPQQSAWQMNRRVNRWLDVNGDRPFLLFVNYMDAHLPHHAPPPFCNSFPGRHPSFSFDGSFEARVMSREQPVKEEEVAHLHAMYDGSIRYLDHHLGLLLDGLRRRGFYEESLIVVVSDHGEYFGEHALLEHSKDVYQPAMVVPLMVHFPGGEPRGELATRAHLVDVLPTVLSTLGLPTPERAVGSDLRSLDGERSLLGENYFARVKDLRRPYGQRFRRVRQAVYQGRWKYIHSSDGDSELYDLENDPAETTNLVLSRPEVAGLLRQWLERHLAGTGGSAESLQPLEVDEETRARLKALGYI